MATANPELPASAWAWTVAGRAESMLDGLRDGVTVHDARGKLLYANRAARREAIARPASQGPELEAAFEDEHRHPIPRDELPFIRVFDLGGSTERLLCAVGRGLGCRWFRVSSSLVDQEGGPPGGVALSIWYDVTDLREANEALQLQASIMEAQREATPAGILVLDPAERLLYWNRRFLEFFGIGEPLLASRSGRAVFSAMARKLKDPQRFERMIEQSSRDPEKHLGPLELSSQDGRTFEFHAAPVEGREGQRYGRAWFARDVSERKHAERQVQELLVERSARASAEKARRNFELLAQVSQVLAYPVENPPDLAAVAEACIAWAGALCLIDVAEEQRLRRVARGREGPAAGEAERLESGAEDPAVATRVRTAITGFGQGAVWMGSFDEAELEPGLFSEDDAEHLLAAGLRGFVAIRIRSKTGTYAALTLVAAQEPGYEAMRVLREVASRLELALDNARLLRDIRASVALRDEFLDVAAHELRTPLTTVLLNAQLTHAQVEKGLAQADDWVRARLALMARQLQRLMRLVSRLLDATRMTGGTLRLELEHLDLAQLAEDIAAQYAEDAARAGAELTVDARAAPIRGDRGRLEQLLQNLLSNAIKYGGGTPVTVEVHIEPKEVILSVQDRGPGIPRSEQERIFDRYVRGADTRPATPGLGLGLYLSKKIVEAHGGTLAVESAPGGGSRFTARLPSAVPAGAKGPIVH